MLNLLLEDERHFFRLNIHEMNQRHVKEQDEHSIFTK